MVCPVDDQIIAPPDLLIKVPDVERRVSGQLAKSESVKQSVRGSVSRGEYLIAKF